MVLPALHISRKQAAIVFAAGATLAGLAAGQLSADVRTPAVAIDWSSAVTTQPQTNWRRDIGGCACDIHPGLCDPNCCCDSDCTAGEKTLYFTDCLSSSIGASSALVPLCSQYLSIVNWESQSGASVFRSSGGALCVVYSNSAVKGSFFDDPGQFVQDSAFATQFSTAAFPASATSYNADRSHILAKAYRYGDPLQVYFPALGITGFIVFHMAYYTSGFQIVNVTYTFLYSLSSTPVINGVLVDVVLGSYTLAAGTAIAQTFVTKFAPSATFAATSYMIRSGVPGYAVGSPVLAGTLTQSGSASGILHIPDPAFGITLPVDVAAAGSSSPVQCPSVTNYASRASITFGENSVFGCTLWLDRTALNSGCAALRTQIYTLQTLTASAVTHVGVFGNASVSNVYDWIKIINNPPAAITGSQTITDAADTCSSLLTDFDVQVLYTYYGSSLGPQAAIVGVRFNYVKGQFQWRCLSPADCVNPSTYGLASATPGSTPQRFRIRSSVSFVRVSTVGTSLYSPPAPRLVAQLPDDIWYPFTLG
nr:Tectonic-1 [Polyrhizophydium stewartii]